MIDAALSFEQRRVILGQVVLQAVQAYPGQHALHRARGAPWPPCAGTVRTLTPCV